MTTSRRAYPSDLSDARWALIEPIVAGWRAARAEQSLGINQPIGDLRDIANAAEALGRGADVRMDGPTSATCPKFRDSPETFRHDDPLGDDRQHVPATHRGIYPNLANPGTRGPARIRQLRLERLQMPSYALRRSRRWWTPGRPECKTGCRTGRPGPAATTVRGCRRPDGGPGRRTDRCRVRVAAGPVPVSYTHLRAHETVLDLVCRLLL